MELLKNLEGGKRIQRWRLESRKGEIRNYSSESEFHPITLEHWDVKTSSIEWGIKTRSNILRSIIWKLEEEEHWKIQRDRRWRKCFLKFSSFIHILCISPSTSLEQALVFTPSPLIVL